jgi:hypothetical protein
MKRTCIAIVALVGASSVLACQGKAPEAQPAKAAAGAPKSGPAFDAAPADGKAPEGDVKAPAPVPDAPAAPDAAPSDLGARFIDPPWFRKHLFPDATKVDLNRTKADAKGLFTSNMRFFLPAGQTAEDCAKLLEGKVGAEVKNLEKKQLEDGRYELKGSTDRYTVTMQCGAPKGELIAFVSYHWTS